MNNHWTPLILQENDTQWGAATLGMILAHYGKFLSLEELCRDTQTTSAGTSAGNILRAAQKHGLICKGYRMDAEALQSLPMPCILHWNGHQFVVLEGFCMEDDEDGIRHYACVIDPSQGRLQLTTEQFASFYSGVALTFSPTEAFEKTEPYRKTPTVLQTCPEECGAASLAMIFGAFGYTVPLKDLHSQVKTEEGCSAGNIKRTAENYGLMCCGYTTEPVVLRAEVMPCIIHWEFNHFMVLEGFLSFGSGADREHYVIVNDPAMGRRMLTEEEFDHGFTGVVLTFSDTEAFRQQMELLGYLNHPWEG